MLSDEIAEGNRAPTRLTAASVGEVMHGLGIMAPTLRSRTPGRTVVGPATTCRTIAGSNLAIHRALAAAAPGDVLVLTATGGSATGLWGGMVTRSAVARGIAGVIADGAVRDTRDILAAGLPVWSAEVSPRGAAKHDPGEVNVDVVCGGVLVRPGDVVVADDDGIAVIPAAIAQDILAQAREREVREERACERLDQGESTFEVLGLSET
jgi:4-hydroxy-4-methyl-2-oxoglutarate aldolase